MTHHKANLASQVALCVCMRFCWLSTQLLSFADFIDLDLNILPFACLFPMDFHLNLMISTIAPLVIIGLLCSTGQLLMLCSRWVSSLKESAPGAAQSAYTYTL